MQRRHAIAPILVIAALLVASDPVPAPSAARASEGTIERAIVVLDDAGDAGDVRATGAEVVDDLDNLDVVVVDATPEEIERLRSSAAVSTVSPDREVSIALTESVPYVGGAVAHDEGFTGAGTWVAVIDTGVATSHPTFAGAPVLEACFAPEDDTCPNGQPSQIGPGSAAPGACTRCAHGTHVAGIAVGRGSSSPAVGVGMAPDAGLIAVQVFERPSAAGATPGATEASILSGLDHVADLADTLPIAAVNLSVTFNNVSSAGSCDSAQPAMAAAIQALSNRGVLAVAASGNSGSSTRISSPACLSSVVSVASIDMADGGTPERVSSFSNTASTLDLVAPGSGIRSSVPGGSGVMNGTSMATPHVSGAVADLRACRPELTISQVASRLLQTGVLRTYTGRGTFRRLDAAALTRKSGDSVGVRNGATVEEVRCQISSGPVDTVPLAAGGRVLVGDWNGDGIDTLGRWDNRVFTLTNRRDGLGPFTTVVYGAATDTPVVGDWDGNGTDTVGVRRGNVFHLRNSNTAGAAQISFGYGTPTDLVLVGDWDGNRTDTPGIRRGNVFHLRNSNTSGAAQISFGYGTPTDVPVVGDWDGNRTDTPGIRRGNVFHLRNSNTSGVAQISFSHGSAGSPPVVGDWDG